MAKQLAPSRDIARLIEIMAALRTPVTGCPWDLTQTFATIAPYTIEEAYEVADAIARSHISDLKDELGDLLLQVVYHAQMAREQNAFDFGDVVAAITAKMIRRHPHVFGSDGERAAGAAPGFWKTIKAQEQAGRVRDDNSDVSASLLDGVPLPLPALTRAVKLQDKAAGVGFDWPSLAPVFDKLKEELAELEEVALPADPRWQSPSPHALHVRGERAGVSGGNEFDQAAAPHTDPDPDPDPDPHPDPLPMPEDAWREGKSGRIEEEFGDLLFVMANVARHLKIDPEHALRSANQKFTRRFAYIEARLAEDGKTPAGSTLEDMDALWNEVRARDKGK